jgi:hypothetical protein
VPLELRRDRIPANDDEEPMKHRSTGVRRLGFPDPDRLVWLDGEGASWVVRADDLQPRANEDRLATAVAQRPRPMSCSPSGWLPVITEHRFAWIEAACVGVSRCYRPSLNLARPRLPALGLSVGVEVWGSWSSTLSPSTQAAQLKDSWVISAFVGIRFDVAAARRHRMTWESLILAARREADMPAVAEGPLAGRHRRALVRQLCEGGSA